MKILKLNPKAEEIIQKYLNLNLGGKQINTPYYMNLKKSKDLRAMVGKGTPEEIELETKIWAKLKNVNLTDLNTEQIREFLISRDIGIDCSGFIVHVLNAWYKAETGKNMWKKLEPMNTSIFGKIAYKLKPVEKLGAEILTNKINSREVNLIDVAPGDVIRSKWKRKNSHHIMLIYKVTTDDNNNPIELEYVNSTEQYGNQNGVRFGKIIINNLNLPLEKQDWIDNDENNVNHTLEGYLVQLEDNGIRRLKPLENLIKRNIS
jgi:hypothetical protein